MKKRYGMAFLLVLVVVSALAGTASARARGYGMVFGVESVPGSSHWRLK